MKMFAIEKKTPAGPWVPIALEKVASYRELHSNSPTLINLPTFRIRRVLTLSEACRLSDKHCVTFPGEKSEAIEWV